MTVGVAIEFGFILISLVSAAGCWCRFLDPEPSETLNQMGRFALAWRCLTSGEFAAKVTALLEAPPVLAAAEPVKQAPVKPASTPKPLRSDAVSLLASLQREGRLIDFLKEPIDGYSDAQIGAAIRDIHRDCGSVLERQFEIRPVLEQAEGSTVALGSKALAGRIKLSGKVGGGSPSSGTLVHHGWQASKCELPVWTGDADTASLIAPAEVEVR